MIERKLIRVLLVDDSSIFRKSIKQNLNSFREINIIGECSDGSLVIDFIQCNEVDVILMDISMKIMGGIEATKLVKDIYPSVKVIVLTSHDEQYYSDEMLLAGASVFLSKWRVTFSEIQQTIVSVFNEG